MKSAVVLRCHCPQVGGVAVEVLPVSLFFREKLRLLMVDMTMACAVSKFAPQTQKVSISDGAEDYSVGRPADLGSFDGHRLRWEVPRVFTPLAMEGVGFESQSFSLGVENVLLDEATMTSRGFSLVQRKGAIEMEVPFGAEGGYRKVGLSLLLVLSEWYRGYTRTILKYAGQHEQTSKMVNLCRVWWRTTCTKKRMWFSWCFNTSSRSSMMTAAPSTLGTECSDSWRRH